MKLLRNTLSLLLVLVLAAGLLPVAALAAQNPFVDVGSGDYYHDAVVWAYSHTPQITQGVDASHFDPNGTVTRGQAVTFLWRAVNCPAPSATTNPFSDVQSDDYYYQPVLWAVEQGVTVGTDARHFSPANTCSTAHIITFLYRALDIGADGWDGEAARWADELSLPDGTGLAVSPDQPCPRGAVVTFLYRALEDSDNSDFANPGTSSGTHRTPSTAVTAADYSILTAQTTDVLAGAETAVDFRLVSSLVVPSFTLCLNGADAGVKLTDADADGVYTGSFPVRQSGDTVLRFTARTTVAGQTVESNVSPVQVSQPLDEETAAALDALTTGLGRAMQEVNNANPGLSAGELAQLRLAAAADFLSGRAETETVSGEPYTLYYTVNGLRLAVDCATLGTAEHADQAAGLTWSELTVTPQDFARSWYITDAEKAAVLSGIANDRSSSYVDADQLRGAVRTANTLRDVGLITSCYMGATLENYRNLEHFAVISLHGGGALRRGEPAIQTFQYAWSANFVQESADIRNGRVLICTYADGNTNYELLPSFFRHYYSESGRTMQAQLVLLGASYGCANDKLAQALMDSGAQTVLGYSGAVSSDYSKHMVGTMLEQLRAGKNIRDALNKAVSVWGGSDQNGTVARILGSEASLLHSQLLNGGFEDGASGWILGGAVEMTTAMLGFKATQGKMATLSTGAGAASNETFSAIFQAVLVPTGAKNLKYEYNVVTEERNRSGAQKNDCFRAGVLTPSGKVDKLLSNMVTGNARFQSYTAARIHSNTPLFATGFFRANRDLSQYAGKVIILCFWVKDKDDSRYDTVAMLDNVRIQ